MAVCPRYRVVAGQRRNAEGCLVAVLIREQAGNEYPLCCHVWLSGFRKAESGSDQEGEYQVDFQVVCEECAETWFLSLLVN